MIHYLTPIFRHWPRWQFIAFVGLALVWLLSAASTTQAQGVNLAGACPTDCNIKLRVLDAKLSERPDGIDAVIEWSLDSIAPEIQLSGFRVTANIEFKNRAKDESTVTVNSTTRKATVRLTQSGKNKDIKFNDVTALKATVSALAGAPADVPVTNILSRSIKGEGGDSAVEVSWGDPGSLPCSAHTIEVNVSARNEKNDRLSGQAFVDLNARRATVELKGAVNKKGLQNPEATIRVKNIGIECKVAKSFTPALVPFGSGTGSNVIDPAVTVESITFKKSGDRIDSFITWDVVEPTGFRATRFEIKVDTELNNGQVFTSTNFAGGTERSAFGGQSRDDLRSVTATIKATFTNAANTAILTREDKRTQQFSAKAALLDIQKPVAPTSQNITLKVTTVKVISKANVHSVVATWQVNVPTNITLTSFEINAQIAGNQAEPKRSVVVLSTQRTATINFTFDEAGNQVSSARVQVKANALRADGSTFQQTATGSSN